MPIEGVPSVREAYIPVPNVYAIGDCAVSLSKPLPATAQVANQKGHYLAKQLNRLASGKNAKPFEYISRGMLAYVGNCRNAREGNDGPGFNGLVHGFSLKWKRPAWETPQGRTIPLFFFVDCFPFPRISTIRLIPLMIHH